MMRMRMMRVMRMMRMMQMMGRRKKVRRNTGRRSFFRLMMIQF